MKTCFGRYFILLSLVVFSFAARAQEVRDVIVDATSTLTERAQARQEMFDTSVETTALNLMREILGVEKFEKNQKLLTEKLAKESNRFVLSMRGQEIEKSGSQYKMKVQLKISIANLRTMLAEQGLLAELSAQGMRLLPLVVVIDRVHSQQIRWWGPTDFKMKNVLVGSVKSIENVLSQNFRVKGLQVLKPVESDFLKKWPLGLNADIWSTEQMGTIASQYGANMILWGQIEVESAPQMIGQFVLKAQWKLWNRQTGRMLAELKEQNTSDIGAFDLIAPKVVEGHMVAAFNDLSTQLNELVARGALSSQTMRLVVSGLIQPTELDIFKQSLTSQVSDIKIVRDRSFSSGVSVFEIEATAGADQLAQTIKSRSFEGFRIEQASARDGQVELRVLKK